MPRFDHKWTLFLDRDGVLNKEKPGGGYITSWEEFVFIEGVLEALRVLARIFGRIVVVTNQRGVGKGYVSEAALRLIHTRLQAAVAAAGGRIDAIYACTDAAEDAPCRKPNPGLALQAKQDFPEIEFHRSVMVGNSRSDMEFGRALGMYTIWIAPNLEAPAPGQVDEVHTSLWGWAQTLDQGQL
ncbi:MAG: HAD-IIIA family hydrolase [Bacteroidia bacterium]|nr:HAD-IIIA family hydrolase [Bacteroidia bacterium]MDW8089619.1 HAD-IIIA family hydrolase [Bacteroidia bacterium]